MSWSTLFALDSLEDRARVVLRARQQRRRVAAQQCAERVACGGRLAVRWRFGGGRRLRRRGGGRAPPPAVPPGVGAAPRVGAEQRRQQRQRVAERDERRSRLVGLAPATAHSRSIRCGCDGDGASLSSSFGGPSAPSDALKPPGSRQSSRARLAARPQLGQAARLGGEEDAQRPARRLGAHQRGARVGARTGAAREERRRARRRRRRSRCRRGEPPSARRASRSTARRRCRRRRRRARRRACSPRRDTPAGARRLAPRDARARGSARRRRTRRTQRSRRPLSALARHLRGRRMACTADGSDGARAFAVALKI